MKEYLINYLTKEAQIHQFILWNKCEAQLTVKALLMREDVVEVVVEDKENHYKTFYGKAKLQFPV